MCHPVTGETLLEEAIQMTAKWGLVKAHDHIVCVQQIHDSFVISAPLPSPLSQMLCCSFGAEASPSLQLLSFARTRIHQDRAY